jgi:hypothetical protein
MSRTSQEPPRAPTSHGNQESFERPRSPLVVVIYALTVHGWELDEP